MSFDPSQLVAVPPKKPTICSSRPYCGVKKKSQIFATAIIGIGLIIFLGIRGYDRAIMLIPSWVMVLIWLTGSWMAITGMIDNDVVQPALGGGLILIILLIGFTIMQHAFAGGALHQGLFSDMERQALAVVGSGDIVFDWDVLRDRVVTKPDISLQLGLPPNSLGGPARTWLPALHSDDRDTFRTTLDVVLEHRRGKVAQSFRLRGADGHYHWFSLRARPGFLRLHGRETIGSQFRQSLVARRQQAHCYSAITAMEFEPAHFQQMAGLVCYYNSAKFHYLYVSHDEENGRHLRVMSCVPDSPQAEEYGRDLLDAQAFTWEEMRNGDDADEELIEEKKAS